MPDISNLIAFALISLAMVLTPGPNMIYLISRSISQGWRSGLISLAGIALADGYRFGGSRCQNDDGRSALSHNGRADVMDFHEPAGRRLLHSRCP